MLCVLQLSNKCCEKNDDRKQIWRRRSRREIAVKSILAYRNPIFRLSWKMYSFIAVWHFGQSRQISYGFALIFSSADNIVYYFFLFGNLCLLENYARFAGNANSILKCFQMLLILLTIWEIDYYNVLIYVDDLCIIIIVRFLNIS